MLASHTNSMKKKSHVQNSVISGRIRTKLKIYSSRSTLNRRQLADFKRVVILRISKNRQNFECENFAKSSLVQKLFYLLILVIFYFSTG